MGAPKIVIKKNVLPRKSPTSWERRDLNLISIAEFTSVQVEAKYQDFMDEFKAVTYFTVVWVCFSECVRCQEIPQVDVNMSLHH